MTSMFKGSLIAVALWTQPVTAQLRTLNEDISKAAQFTYLEKDAYSREASKPRSPLSDVKISDTESLKNLKTKIAYQNEIFNDNLEKTAIANLRMVFENTNVSLMNYDLDRNLVFSNFEDFNKVALQQQDGIEFGEHRTFQQKTGSATAFKTSLKSYLNQFYKIEFAETKVIASEGTSANDLLVAQDIFKTLIKVDVRGLTRTGRPRADKGYFVLTFRKDGRLFKISDFIIKQLQTARLTRPSAFSRIVSSSGFDGLRAAPRDDVFRQSGFAFAVDDYNNDGSVDAFIGSDGASTLWTGLAGRFAKSTATEIEKLTSAKSAAFVDLNNDGWKDLVVSRWTNSNTSEVVVFKNDNGTFKIVTPALLPLAARSSAVPMTIADFNNDGKVDIYIGLSGAGDFSAGAVYDPRVSVNGLFLNQGDFKFTGNQESVKPSFATMMSPQATFASDYDGDGTIDLLLIDDRANLSTIYKNSGLAQFVLKRTDNSILDGGRTMGIATGDINQDGLSDYVISNFGTHAQERLQQSLLSTHPTILGSPLVNRGLRALINSNDGHFIEWTRVTGLDDVGDGASDATLVDYDGDGLLDIYVVNGIWSGSSRDDKLDSTFAIAQRMNLLDIFGNQKKISGMLLNERAPANKTFTFAGFQRNRLFKNLGHNKFIEVGYLEGVDSMADGLTSVVADLNKDNKPDLIVRNNDSGAFDRSSNTVDIYQNNYFKNNNLWITLKGVKSNGNAIGAKLIVTVNGTTQYREVTALTGTAHGERVQHFGLGTSRAAQTVMIKWPSGITETYTQVEAGRHTFTEKPTSIAAF